MVFSQSCQPRTEVSWWESLPRLYFQRKQKDGESSASWMDKPLTPLRNGGKTRKYKILISFTTSNSTDPKPQFCFWEGFATTTPRGQALRALGAPLGPRVCPATLWVTPLNHPGLHPTGCPHSSWPLFGRARNNRLLHNTEAAKRVCAKWSSNRKTLWAAKRKQAVVPRHQVIWNKAGRSKGKNLCLCRACSCPSSGALLPAFILAIAALHESRESTPKLSL